MRKTVEKLAVTGLAWAVALTVSLPILWMALTAFKTDLDALQLPPKVLFTPTLENFAAAHGSTPILNSVVESSGATALCFLFAFSAAYVLAFHGGKNRIPERWVCFKGVPRDGLCRAISELPSRADYAGACRAALAAIAPSPTSRPEFEAVSLPARSGPTPYRCCSK